MKRCSGLILMMLLVVFVSGTLAQWSNPVEVSWGTGADMDIDEKTGNVHIVAVTHTGEIAYTVLDKNGAILKQEMVPGVTGEEGKGYFGPSVAVDSKGFPHITYRILDNNNKFDLFYKYKTAEGWSARLQIGHRVLRGYSFRIDVDQKDRAHLAYGSAEGEDVWGPVTYVRIEGGTVVDTQTGMTRYRADDRIEIDARGDETVQLVLGCPDPNGGPIHYWRSTNSGEDLLHVGDIHHPDCRDRNGSPDVFTDTTGIVHFCYGANDDASRDRTSSVRYAKYENGIRKIDMAVTPIDFLKEWHQSLGLASIATSNSGQTVIICFQQTDGGYIYAVQSDDGGETWSEPVQITNTEFDGYEGRNKHLLRANNKRFYLVHPGNDGKIYFRWYEATDTKPPVADAGGPYTGREGSSVLFDASNSYDNSGIKTYEWDWDANGIFDETRTEPTAEHLFNDDYSGYVILRVTDVVDLTDIDSAEVTIANTNPVVELEENINGDEGQELTFTATASDSGSLDTFSYRWNFGDSETANGQTVKHRFADNGVFAVVCEVTDKDGGMGTGQMTATIQNVPPVPDAGGPYRAGLNVPITFQGSATDAGVADTATLVFEWDFDNNGTFDAQGKSVQKAFAATGDFVVKLKVSDDDGGSAEDTAKVMIQNQPPQILTIPNQEIKEGEQFKDIPLDNYVTDPDNTPAEISWMAEGMQNLSVTISNRVATITIRRPKWTGSETIQFIARDPAGAADTAQVTFTVKNVNDPPVAMKIADQTIKENGSFDVIQLDDVVNDPDNSADELNWNVYGNRNLIVEINRTVGGEKAAQNLFSGALTGVWTATIVVADSEWNSSEIIHFVVTDPGRLADTTAAKFTVQAVNDPPRIGTIPEQIINSGQEFPPLKLDNYVFDPDHADNLLKWSATGQQELVVAIINREARVTTPNPTWSKSEVITFRVTDLEGLSDEVAVKFTVDFHNQPPRLAQVPDIVFNEDDTTYISRTSLVTLVTDPDNQPADFNFSLLPMQNIDWGILTDNGSLYLTTKPNWYGREQATLVVNDGRGGADSSKFLITVNSQPDPPAAFQLLAPLDITLFMPSPVNFLWRQAKDPDGDEVKYYWMLGDSHDLLNTDALADTLISDTTFTFPLGDLPNVPDELYWQVIAFSFIDNQKQVSDNMGRIRILAAVEDISTGALPTQFRLLPNHPNPFNPETRIVFHLPRRSEIKLEIFNTMGKLVKVLDQGSRAAGIYAATWHSCDESGRPVSSGTYLCRLQAEGQQFIQKMLLMR